MSDTSGPAFPVPPNSRNIHNEDDVWSNGRPGMSLRDYFAAQALQGLLSATRHINQHIDIARCSYDYADAMLLARKTPRTLP